MPKPDELPIFTQWTQFLEWLLPAVEKFPKRVRFTFADRMRILLRLCHRLHYLPHKGYEHAMRNLNETGRMLGGWIKQQQRQA